jgi:hypothetical protein
MDMALDIVRLMDGDAASVLFLPLSPEFYFGKCLRLSDVHGFEIDRGWLYLTSDLEHLSSTDSRSRQLLFMFVPLLLIANLWALTLHGILWKPLRTGALFTVAVLTVLYIGASLSLPYQWRPTGFYDRIPNELDRLANAETLSGAVGLPYGLRLEAAEPGGAAKLQYEPGVKLRTLTFFRLSDLSPESQLAEPPQLLYVHPTRSGALARMLTEMYPGERTVLMQARLDTWSGAEDADLAAMPSPDIEAETWEVVLPRFHWEVVAGVLVGLLYPAYVFSRFLRARVQGRDLA